MSANLIKFVSVLYVAAGAFLLGRAAVFVKRETIARADAIVGLSLMILGFLLQQASALWGNSGWTCGLAVALLGTLLIAYRRQRQRTLP